MHLFILHFLIEPKSNLSKKKIPIDPLNNNRYPIISRRIKRSFVIFTLETWNLSIRNEYRFPIK